MRVQRCVFGGLLIALLAPPTFAQTTFATLTDSAGAVAPAATVGARHVLSNDADTIETNQVGHYTLGQLREGEYILRVRMPGFKEFVAQNIQLAAQDLRRIDIRLEVGSIRLVEAA